MTLPIPVPYDASIKPAATASHPVPLSRDRARRAKIVATLGPASSTPEVFRELVRAGLDVARLNFSHGSHAQKAELIRMVRMVAEEFDKPICILADLQGPKIRTGRLKDGLPVQLVAGRRITITPHDIEGTAERVGTVFTTLAENLKPGSRILLSDGLIELHVVEVQGEDVVCEIINGGLLGEKKGINLPGIAGEGAVADGEGRGLISEFADRREGCDIGGGVVCAAPRRMCGM